MGEEEEGDDGEMVHFCICSYLSVVELSVI